MTNIFDKTTQENINKTIQQKNENYSGKIYSVTTFDPLFGCQKKECINLFRELVSNESKNTEKYLSGNSAFIHCELCCTIFQTSQSEISCASCFREICEKCTVYNSNNDEFYCKYCPQKENSDSEYEE